MKSKTVPNEQAHVPLMTGDLTITQAENLKARLAAKLEGAQRIRIIISDVTAIDLSCLQLLCSAHRTAAAEGKQLILEEPLHPELCKLINQAGFKRKQGCSFNPDTQCIWHSA